MIYANNLQNATKALSGKNSSRRVAQAAKFSWLSLFFSSPTAAADAAARGPSAIFAQGLVTTSGSHVVVTFRSVQSLKNIFPILSFVCCTPFQR